MLLNRACWSGRLQYLLSNSIYYNNHAGCLESVEDPLVFPEPMHHHTTEADLELSHLVYFALSAFQYRFKN